VLRRVRARLRDLGIREEQSPDCRFVAARKVNWSGFQHSWELESVRVSGHNGRQLVAGDTGVVVSEGSSRPVEEDTAVVDTRLALGCLRKVREHRMVVEGAGYCNLVGLSRNNLYWPSCSVLRSFGPSGRN